MVVQETTFLSGISSNSFRASSNKLNLTYILIRVLIKKVFGWYPAEKTCLWTSFPSRTAPRAKQHLMSSEYVTESAQISCFCMKLRAFMAAGRSLR
ncbi:hypothetical protein HanIR_Chr16g0818141 [Helianthus annuus]|nr:hypothetical protein HanIR_Chr16g0818141 [Helianthus annuus]